MLGVPRVRWTRVTRPAARAGTARLSSRGTTPTTLSATSDLAALDTLMMLENLGYGYIYIM